MTNKTHDIAVIGAGPAGLTAAIYAARGKYDILIIEKAVVGGTALMIDNLENYPGFPEGTKGYELAMKMEAQAKKFGAVFINDDAQSIKKENGVFRITCSSSSYFVRAVVIASGSKPVKLGVLGEEKLIGKGISWCATCDGAFFRNQPIAVVGGGNSALHEALYLTRFASEVYVIHRRNEFRASPYLQDRLKTNPKIHLVLGSVVEKVIGEDKLEKISIKNVADGSLSELQISGLFEAVGNTPNTGFCRDILKLDEKGCIITDDSLESSEPGIFAVGDVRTTKLRQVATAVGDGAYVAAGLEKYLSK